jgi:site-specific DNA-adenine methylase
MKNHFIFSYVGNKRDEVEKIYENINFDNIDTIIEPFCGSCALSYYIWSLNKDKNYKYILNDLDNDLIDLILLIKNGNIDDINNDINKLFDDIRYIDDPLDAKKKYMDVINNNGIYGYYIKHKYYSIRAGLFPLASYKRMKKTELEKTPFYDFLKNADIEITCGDGVEIIKKYDNKKCFLFIDPPYLQSHNAAYDNNTNNNMDNIYEYLLKIKLCNLKSKTLICHENNWLFNMLFKEYFYGECEYCKKYASSKKKETVHILARNY